MGPKYVKKTPNKALSYLLVASLCTGTVAGAFPLQQSLAAETTSPGTTVYAPSSLGKISIGGSNYIELKEVQQLGRMVRFTLSVTNGGSSDLHFIDYWVKLRSTSGNQFSIALTDADKDKNRIAPKSTETFTFYSTVNESTTLSDLVFDVIRWDFNVSSFQRTLGTIQVPAAYKPVAPADAIRSMQINGVAANTAIKRTNTGKTSDKYVTSLSFMFENTGTKSFVIPAYEYYIVTPEGLSYPLSVSGLSENTSLHPRFKKEITLKGELPATVKSEGWLLVIAQKASEGAVDALPVASFELPSASDEDVLDSVPLNGSKEVIISDQTVLAKVARTVRNENDNSYLATMRFSFVNQGNEPVTLPKYTFKVRTAGGLLYPASGTLDNIRLDPLVEKEVELKVTIPNSVEKNGWKLVMAEPVDADSTAADTIATFDLPNDNPTGLNQGAVYEYSNDDGTYMITFTEMQRLPWEDQDVISAGFTFVNPGSSSLPMPELQGHFLLDNKIKVDAKMVAKDSLIALQPGTSVDTVLYGKVPYTYQYNTIKLVIEEKAADDDSAVATVVEFDTNDAVADLPVIEAGEAHNIKGVGRSAAVKMRSVRTYNGLDGNLFTTLVDVQNLEKRYTDIASLVGHFTTDDGLMFPVTFTEFSGKVSPQGTATLIASSTLPATVNTAALQLILGEGVKDGALVVDGEAEAYMNAVSFQLPLEEAAKNTFDKLTLFPYTISLKNVRSKMDTTESFVFSFDYELQKNTFVQNAGDDHKFTIELVDNTGSELYGQTFTLGAADATTSDTNLKLGSGSKAFTVNDSTLFTRLSHVDKFEIRIYDEYKGVKKLLSSVSYDWFAN